MVQLNQPKMVRKDVLESLRDVIIFMQGYEKFRQMQQEKVALFAQLKEDVKELQRLINTELHHHLPPGKLSAIRAADQKKKDMAPAMEMHEPAAMGVQVVPVKANVAPVRKVQNDLSALDSQLRDIEGQLKGL
tara:strand:+ start:468 stop:866 length:399 start_codon:yes stop_codon:yes gene_type:complete